MLLVLVVIRHVLLLKASQSMGVKFQWKHFAQEIALYVCLNHANVLTAFLVTTFLALDVSSILYVLAMMTNSRRRNYFSKACKRLARMHMCIGIIFFYSFLLLYLYLSLKKRMTIFMMLESMFAFVLLAFPSWNTYAKEQVILEIRAALLNQSRRSEAQCQ